MRRTEKDSRSSIASVAPIGRGLLRLQRTYSQSPAPGTSKQTVISSGGLLLSEASTTQQATNENQIRSRLRQNPRKTQHFITMAEAVSHINEKTRNVVVLPPANGDDDIPTDEETFDEEADIVHDFETEVVGEVEVEGSSSSSEDEEEKDSCRWRKHATFHHEWPPNIPLLPLEETYPVLACKSEYEIWCEVFDDNIINLIMKETLLYAHRDKTHMDFNLTEEELLKFLGIILFSGYHSVPNEKHYWSNSPDLGVDLIRQTMSRDRFWQIKGFLHLADNHSLEEGNKMAKISQLYELLNQSLQRVGVFHSDISIDESMVPYFGRHSSKMYIKGKPIRFGYKIWTLAGSDGYPYMNELYSGKRQNTSTSSPLGPNVVSRLLKVVEAHSDPTSHHVYFDNFFTSYQLLNDLRKIHFKATGTIRTNRTNGAAKLLETDKELSKRGRGAFDYRCDGNVFVTKWHDNSIVHLASNCFTHEPLQSTKRRVKKDLLKVSQPFLIRKYNEGMGGVDLLDRLLGAYRPTILGKKWWWPLFVNAVNMSVVAAWRLYSNLNSKNQVPSHFEFRRAITLCLLKGTFHRKIHAKGKLQHLPFDIRYDGIGHTTEETTQGRCVLCSTNTRTKCSKCDVRLHHSRGKQCYFIYHTQP
jgi:hypothetical protein